MAWRGVSQRLHMTVSLPGLQTPSSDAASQNLYKTYPALRPATETPHHVPSSAHQLTCISIHHTTTILQPFFRDHPGEPVPEENFWTLWCKGRLTEADTNHPAGHHSIRTNQCPPTPSPHFFTGRMPFLPPNEQCQCTEGNSSHHFSSRGYINLHFSG